MIHVLFAWELGGGWGHLAPIAALAKEFRRRGHAVGVALRDLSHVARLLDPRLIACYQAPQQIRRPQPAREPVLSLADIYDNEAFAEERAITARVQAWCQLFDFAKADVVICDHSPTAMLAARCRNVKTIGMGTGFFLPPDERPWPAFSTSEAQDAKQERTQRESMLVERLNAVLRRWHAPELRQLSDLQAECRRRTLLTRPELDHYGPRASGDYFPLQVAATPTTQQTGDVRRAEVFAYLKHRPEMLRLIEFLRQQRRRVEIVLDGAAPELAESLSDDWLHVLAHPVDLARILPHIRFAVLNGNHATTLDVLAAGKPCWQVPLTTEQRSLSQRAAATGACMMSSAQDSRQWPLAWGKLIAGDTCARAAGELAARWSCDAQSFTVERLVDDWVAALES